MDSRPLAILILVLVAFTGFFETIKADELDDVLDDARDGVNQGIGHVKNIFNSVKSAINDHNNNNAAAASIGNPVTIVAMISAFVMNFQ